MGYITSFTNSGLKDWFLQRVTAIIIMLYLVFIIIVFISDNSSSYHMWINVFQKFWVKIFTILLKILVLKFMIQKVIIMVFQQGIH